MSCRNVAKSVFFVFGVTTCDLLENLIHVLTIQDNERALFRSHLLYRDVDLLHLSLASLRGKPLEYCGPATAEVILEARLGQNSRA